MAPLFPKSIEQIFGTIAGIVLVIASASYIYSAIIKKHIKPRPISWFGWSLMMGISLISQITSKGWEWNQIGMLASTVSCLLITILTVLVKNYTVKKSDWLCLFLGTVCVAIYLSTKNALLTTSIAILADFIIALPTVHNAYSDPLSEKASAWMYGIISWSCTLLICIGHPIVYALFAIYLFLFNTSMFVLTHRKLKTKF
ncbi:MAG TPA: hypothetical protein VG621_03685 [Candidatus Paceibacterota bacterium]|nr:hypothetical protein [Candidatus Paceibacterota bacterium]